MEIFSHQLYFVFRKFVDKKTREQQQQQQQSPPLDFDGENFKSPVRTLSNPLQVLMLFKERLSPKFLAIVQIIQIIRPVLTLSLKEIVDQDWCGMNMISLDLTLLRMSASFLYYCNYNTIPLKDFVLYIAANLQ